MGTATNTDFLQATIEIFGAAITVVLGVMFVIITGKRKKSENSLMLLIMLSAVSLLVDAGWYIYDGNSTTHGIIINWICNFLIFILNPVMVALANTYILKLIKETGNTPKKMMSSCSYTASAVAVLIPFSNLFTEWMYEIDEFNIYHRLSGWYVFTAVNSLAIIFIVLMILCNKKSIGRKKRMFLYTFLLSPFAGIALQSFNLGISFIQTGVAIGSVALLAGYMIDWVKSTDTKENISREKKTIWIIEGVFLTMLLCISASVFSCVISINSISNEEAEQNSTSIAYMISGSIESLLAEPVTVSATMAQSDAIINALSVQKLTGTEEERILTEFMQRIKKKYGYQVIFTASGKSKAYYTPDGFSRIMDTNPDGFDRWYTDFTRRGNSFELNIDDDKDHNMEKAYFVNTQVLDKNNRPAGVCGVAVSLENLTGLISKIENDENVRISITDAEGLVQISTDKNRIENEYVDFDFTRNEEISYHRNDSKAVLVKYYEKAGLYIVIEDNEPQKINSFRIAFPSIVIYLVGLSITILFNILFTLHEKKRNYDLNASIMLSETDGLTGLNNRYSMEKYISKIQENGIPENLVNIMIDVNGLKSVNDNIGHAAGDELIIAAAKCISDTFSEYGKMFRTGGDEYVVMCQCDETLLNELLEKFRACVGQWHGNMVNELSVSIGAAAHQKYPEMSVTELQKQADILMYQDKNEYYRRTGKDRRKR